MPELVHLRRNLLMENNDMKKPDHIAVRVSFNPQWIKPHEDVQELAQRNQVKGQYGELAYSLERFLSLLLEVVENN